MSTAMTPEERSVRFREGLECGVNFLKLSIKDTPLPRRKGLIGFLLSKCGKNAAEDIAKLRP